MIGPLVTVVIPTLEEACVLPGLLDHLASLPGRFEVIVADGGSRDGTAEAARRHPSGPQVAVTATGRARQMNAAAAAAHGEALLFLHADTRLPPAAYDQLAAALADPRLIGGNFALRFDGGDSFSRLLGAWYALQRRLGVYYGDSAIWLRASVFRALGGYRELPIMEDYDLARRLGRAGETRCLAGPAVTSARRWQAVGLPRTIASWVAIRWLFLAGAPPERLLRLYPYAR